MGNEATVLGFVGLPYTLATYLVEGKSSKVRQCEMIMDVGMNMDGKSAPASHTTTTINQRQPQEYLEIKKMMFQEPALLHQMLSILADNIGEYANFQVSFLPINMCRPLSVCLSTRVSSTLLSLSRSLLDNTPAIHPTTYPPLHIPMPQQIESRPPLPRTRTHQ